MEALIIKRHLKSNKTHLDNLDRFVGKDVEITVRECNSEIHNTNGPALKGTLKNYSDKNLIDKEKDAWADSIGLHHDS